MSDTPKKIEPLYTRLLDSYPSSTASLGRALMESSLDGIAIIDQNFKVVEANQCFADMLGYSLQELHSLYVWDWEANLSEAEIRSNKANFEAMKQTIETRHRRKDGTIYHAEVSIGATRINDQPLVFTIARDITKRKALEEELLTHRQHLEQLVEEKTQSLMDAKLAADSSNQAKSNFLANMSHEIRTPLTSITGMVELLREYETAPDKLQMLDKIDIASEHLLDVINAILDLSKIEAGKFELENVEINLEHIVNNISLIIAERAKSKGLQIFVENQTIANKLLGDPTSLQQALLNYASNAVKYTDTGHIVLRTRIDDESETEVQVRFEVEDTGIGIEPEIANRIFSAFEQADNTHSRKYGGTGLGLVITKKIAELYNGNAGVQSRPGSGSTFWFTCRLKKTNTNILQSPEFPEPSESAKDILARDYAGHRILAVDDEPANLALVKKILVELAGQQVDTANNGREAVDAAKNQSYDMILMDMQMPIMNGMEAAQHIRKLPLGKHIPIITMTANAFTKDKQLCLESGMDEVITKPFKIKSFCEVVLKWLKAPREKHQGEPKH